LSKGIALKTIEHIKENLSILELDIEKGKVLNRSVLDTGRYDTIKLKGKSVKVHHVISIAGGLPVIEGVEVNHIDGNKRNNELSNLEVATHAENVQHAYDRKLLTPKIGESLSWTGITEEQAREIKRLLKEGVKAPKIAELVGTSKHTVYHIKYNRTWKHIEA
jgi:HNH endonuclease/Helix-turn-helix domain of resolvase